MPFDYDKVYQHIKKYKELNEQIIHDYELYHDPLPSDCQIINGSKEGILWRRERQ